MIGGLAIPRFEPEVYFAQRLEAYGVFVDRFGTIRRQFNVEVKGTRTSDGFILDEDFLYDDGERETRRWIVTALGDGRYRGCLLYTSPSPRDLWISRMPSSA